MKLFIRFFTKYLEKKRHRRDLRRKILSKSGSYEEMADNITKSITKSRDLYKLLITKVHPDRFIDEKKTIATELSSRITENKKDYAELLKLKEEVDLFLNKDH